jgi:hypothetical protein
MWKRLIWFLAAATVTGSGTVPQWASAQITADALPFTADEIAIKTALVAGHLETPSRDRS